jgi:hypothetical protein
MGASNEGSAMKRRYLTVAGILAVCICLTLGVLAIMPPRPGVTKANFDRIEEGMTLPEVEAILGSDRGSRGIVTEVFLPIGHEIEEWGGDEGFANIVFDERRRVIRKDWNDAPLPLLQRIRRWLPWT